MRAKIIPILAVLFLVVLMLNSCEDTTYKEYKGYAPVYLSYDALRSAPVIEQSAELKNPGKIYFKDSYIFIVEDQKGIHIYDNSDPSSPVQKKFIKLPGVVDISISGTIMYADSYVDLVVLDLSDIDNIRETGRVLDVFPYTVPAYKTDYPTTSVDKDKGVVVEWQLKTIKEKVETNPNPYPYYPMGGVFMFNDKVNAAGASSGMSGNGVGLAGSMARFGIISNFMYILDKTSLKVFDISNKTNPVKIGDLNPGWNVETMFLTEKNMFLGTTTGMAIFDISNPSAPIYKSFYSHIRSCDPVVVKDTLAYITLRTGTGCGGGLNCLDVLSIKDITNPKILVSYQMTHPQGMGIDGNLLFLCDGNDGLKIYDTTDPYSLLGHIIYTYPDIKAFDAIPIGGQLVLISVEGLYQYDYTDVKNISLLSTIPVVK